MPAPRDLADALIEVVRERMAEQGVSGAALAGRAGIAQPTLSRKFRGHGDLTFDEADALAVALGEPGIESLLAEARRRM